MPTPQRLIMILALSGGLAGGVAAGAASGSGLSGVGAGAGPVDPVAVALEERYWADVEPLLARSCMGCHGEDVSKGGVRFDDVWSLDDALAMADTLATARELVTARQMPPPDNTLGAPALTDHEVQTVQQWIDAALDYFPPDGAIDPGWFTIHRLNRAEYRNSVRDVLGLDAAATAGVDLAAGLPADDTGYGFDNNASVLTMSPLQVEAYLNAAGRALYLALGPVVEASTEHRPLRGLAVRGGGRGVGAGFMLYSNGSVGAVVDVPVTGEYEISVDSWGTRGGDELPMLSIRVDGVEARAVMIEAVKGEAQRDSVRVRLERGPRLVEGAFTNDFYQPGVADRNLGVESVTLAGPLSEAGIERPVSYTALLFAQPAHEAHEAPEAEHAAARAVLARFAARAYRRAVTRAELDGLMRLYEAGRDAGDGHEEAVRLCLTAVLVSPNFLYRTVANPWPDDPGRVYRLSGPELASRLSYFLWSGPPDEELMRLATGGSLTDEGVLLGQVSRMLADPRSGAFIENFSGQWLLLRNLERLAIDQSRFPAYDAALREAMITEATMFFADVVRADRSVMSFVDSDYTFVNDALAALYGFAGLAEQEGFRRFELPEGSVRGGVLTMGAVLTVTSNPTRTSPVKRGLYVLDQILGTPPPPPPPDIPPLEQAVVDGMENASTRERLKAHLMDASCASCHARMDPIGLAMENFDAIGAWREADEGGPIDASGVLPGGVSFVGPAELKRVLLAREDLFVENLTRKLLTYALGRGLEPFDRPAVTRIAARAKADGNRISAIIEGIVLSEAFRACRGREP